MLQRPQRGDPFWFWMLHGWVVLSWTVIGLLALITLLGSTPPPQKYGSLALLAVLATAYAYARRRPDAERIGHGYLALLVVVLGALAGLRDGFGVLYALALPQFVVFASGVRSAVVGSGLGAVAITVGGLSREGWTDADITANTLSSLAVCGVSVAIATLTPRALEIRDERGRLRTRLADTEAELAEAQKRQGAAEERERMARDIHDTLAQGFASIIVLAEAARSGLDRDVELSARQLQSIEQTARENLTEARVLVGAAPSSSVATGSVAATIRRTLDRFTEDTGITVTAELPDVDRDCDRPTRIALLRCTQESLANVRKHAAAGTVGVVLARTPDGVELEITDDGRGFDTGSSSGFGLNGMRGRVAELGGALDVTSSPGDGTRVLVAIPTNAQE
ncbi:Sensor histidine kinase DesK [Streptomyces sp. YIM 130001]|uniref:sensor histidine kinase n=1 Tax=Streptomyces sp. YIM 130001 TaxID=2259644 RepID=UPI000E649716|nr:sensor histidine kinase [Streptomyces sp. YIM 130001]RII21063.1 Sensor histidine kinase DesK [Streptomyces sp. YIM 130001]